MPETIANAVAERDKSPAALIASYKSIYEGVLPAHMTADAFVRLAQGVLRKSDDLARTAMSNPRSLMAALLDCARLGHEPGTPAYYLVPLKGAIEGWEGYRGVIERIYRAGAVASVRAEVVRENDYFQYEDGMPRPVHRYDRFAGEAERGPLKGVYAYAEMLTGGISRVVTMGREEVYKHRDMNRSADRADSPWKKWEQSMWLKCAAHELEKWVPSSAEYRRQEVLAQAAAERASASPRPVQAEVGEPAARGEVFDGELVDASPSAPAGPQTDAEDWPETAAPGGQA